MQFLDIKNGEIQLSTLNLINKEIKISKLKTQTLQFSTKLQKNGKFSLQEYLEKNVKKTTNNTFKISTELPQIELNNYLIKIKDASSGQRFKITGKDYKIAQSITKKRLDNFRFRGFLLR